MDSHDVSRHLDNDSAIRINGAARWLVPAHLREWWNLMRSPISPTLAAGEDPGADPSPEQIFRVRGEVNARMNHQHPTVRGRQHRHALAIVRLTTRRTELDLVNSYDVDQIENLHKLFLDGAGLVCAGEHHG